MKMPQRKSQQEKAATATRRPRNRFGQFVIVALAFCWLPYTLLKPTQREIRVDNISVRK